MKPLRFIFTRRLSIAALVFGAIAAHGRAGPITVLHSFLGGGQDGAHPTGLVLDGSSLYGTTTQGGLNSGTVYRLNTSGSSFSLLHRFSGVLGDGEYPRGNLVLSGSRLYGTTGAYGGTIYGIDTTGSGFATLHKYPWAGGSGTGSHAGLALSGSTLYGTTVGTVTSPESPGGTVFSIDTGGSTHTPLYDFAGSAPGGGYGPRSALTLSGSTMYGMTSQGGADGQGTVFRMNTDGTGFLTLHDFTGFQQFSPIDGSIPMHTALQLVGSRLYGVTFHGGRTDQGTWNQGVLFGIDTDGSDFDVLHSFGGGSDGAHPTGTLAVTGSTEQRGRAATIISGSSIKSN